MAKHEVGLPDVAKIIAVDMKGLRRTRGAC